MPKTHPMPVTFLLAMLAVPLATGTATAIDSYTIEIKNHRFEPSELTVPAHTKVKLIVKNLDPTPEEFESYELNREKVILGGRSGIVFVGPLEAGTYPFFGDFNQDTAKGVLHVE